MTDPAVSAVIVAWNSGAALATCADALRASASNAELELQLVVVDNASTDRAVEEVSLIDGDIDLRNPVNAGYGVAAAQGMARAGAPWILLVNPDVVVAPGFFAALTAELRSIDEDVATLVPELRYASERALVNSRGITVDDVGIPAEIDLGREVTDRALTRDVMGGTSGCCLLRASAVRSVGGPEPVFFAYLEDVDLALRLQRAGYRARFVPGAIAWHGGSASTGEGSPLKTFLAARNRRILFRLHGPFTLRARAWRLPIEIGHGAVSSLQGSLTAPWLGRVDALRLRRYTRFLRRARHADDSPASPIPLTPRAELRGTLRRKRAARRLSASE